MKKTATKVENQNTVNKDENLQENKIEVQEEQAQNVEKPEDKQNQTEQIPDAYEGEEQEMT